MSAAVSARFGLLQLIALNSISSSGEARARCWPNTPCPTATDRLLQQVGRCTDARTNLAQRQLLFPQLGQKLHHQRRIGVLLEFMLKVVERDLTGELVAVAWRGSAR